jgi:hypothetical protein
MKLELKHVTPYLPYSLKGVVNGWVLLVSGVDKPYTLSDVIIKFLNEKSDEPIQNIKLILHPLSDLTKEIEHNGEKFVPMVKLLHLYETNHFHENENLKCVIFDLSKIISCEHNKYELINREDFTVKYLVPTSNLGTLIYSFTYDPEIRRFACRDETRRMSLGVGHQLDLFQKLFEWHFDVFGLIEQGLAIDINTLKH